MNDTLVVVPTKDRPEYLNALIQNLITQKGEFDIYIADMCTDPKILFDNAFLRTGLERLCNLGHQYYVETVIGTNQLAGYNTALSYALKGGYKYCIGGDDDIIYEDNWIVKGRRHMINDPNLGICAGITLNPRHSVESQTIGIGLPPDTIDHPDFRGKIEQADYYHCIFVSPTPEVRYYEVIYGGFFFRPEDAATVGGFPTFLSPLGYRGEMYTQTAIFFMGRKLMVDPTMISWHYQAPYGGLRFDDATEAKYLAQDQETWKKWVAKRQPIVAP